MPKKTKLERCAEIGVSMPCLNNWERCGVDVFDDEQVKTRISKMRNLPPELKPEFHPKVKPSAPAFDGEEPTTIDIEEIIARLSSCDDKHQAQTIKLQIDGLLNAYKLREAAGRYVSKVVVDESLIRIGAVFKSSLMRMEADLPQMMEGMNPAKMQEVIRDKVDEVLRMMEDEYLKVYGSDN